MNNLPKYVIDTNVLVDYVDIIPAESAQRNSLKGATVDLTHAHLIIPTAVIRELSSFKGEKSERGKAARTVLHRLKGLIEGQKGKMWESYHLYDSLVCGEQLISVLPIHKNFKKALPFCPSEDDMDGQIILATLTTMFLEAKLPIDGTADRAAVNSLKNESVTLLTNDNGLAIRARQRGIKTSRYGYKYPDPYTGRRDIFVPRELFLKFYNERRVEREHFEEMMPDESRLIANEFIVMKLEDPVDYPSDFDPEYNPYFFHIGRYDQFEDAIIPLEHLNSFPVRPHNDGQAIYAEALANPDFSAVVCTGPAGSGKTYMATIYGYQACKNGDYIGVTAVPCESHSKIGALPGDLDEKMDPEVQPLKNALRNFLIGNEPKFRKDLETLRKFGTESARSKRGNNNSLSCLSNEEAPEKRPLRERVADKVDLIWNNWFSSIPIENARGRDFSYELAIYDEFQDQNIAQADTLIKRIGTDGKIVLTGDINQIHAPYLDKTNNGLVYASRLLFDNPLVAQVCFTEDEVVRHPLVKEIARRQKEEDNTSET